MFYRLFQYESLFFQFKETALCYAITKPFPLALDTILSVVRKMEDVLDRKKFLDAEIVSSCFNAFGKYLMYIILQED